MGWWWEPDAGKMVALIFFKRNALGQAMDHSGLLSFEQDIYSRHLYSTPQSSHSQDIQSQIHQMLES